MDLVVTGAGLLELVLGLSGLYFIGAKKPVPLWLLIAIAVEALVLVAAMGTAGYLW
ncbi:hypothetical protein NOGI109294_24880 [Nocardiopsis gilva]|uniref:hypothetical protein n=1 Tax=Nocardiopsis gilva TaxID=280236 RepID=UPI000347FC20|nr:hypothetical protein [Nocardiopsis gilva]